MLEPHADRITWDAPLHSLADIKALEWKPKAINSKPSRFGSLAGAALDLRVLRRARGSRSTAAARARSRSAAARSSTWRRSSTPTPRTTPRPSGYNDPAVPAGPADGADGPGALGDRLPLGLDAPSGSARPLNRTSARPNPDFGLRSVPTNSEPTRRTDEPIQLRRRLNEQVANEFAAHQQYVAIAVHYDAETLPRLAAFFYRQAVEERNHAMMITQYLLDADLEVRTPGVEAPEIGFADIVAPVELALAQEKRVTEQISALAAQGPRRGRLPGRAVHAVVHQGAGRGGLDDDRPAQGRRARQGQPAARPRSTWPARRSARTAATTRPPRPRPAARSSGSGERRRRRGISRRGAIGGALAGAAGIAVARRGAAPRPRPAGRGSGSAT